MGGVFRKEALDLPPPAFINKSLALTRPWHPTRKLNATLRVGLSALGAWDGQRPPSGSALLLQSLFCCRCYGQALIDVLLFTPIQELVQRA
jgi:hypothetical protein